LIALVIAMLVDRVAAASASTPTTGRANAVTDDISRYSTPLVADTLVRALDPRPGSDPFGNGRPLPVASTATATPTAPRGPQLTAILIAEDGSVAVIDDEALSVGGRIKTGERVASIQADRVWVVKPNGQWRMLTLATGDVR
jgi:hypothetical protein